MCEVPWHLDTASGNDTTPVFHFWENGSLQDTENCSRPHLSPPMSSHASFPQPKDLPGYAGSQAIQQPNAIPLPTISLGICEPAKQGKRAPLPIDTLAALESTPELLSQIQSLWLSRDLNIFIAQLLLETRNGVRPSFPQEVSNELQLIANINHQLREEETSSLLGLSLAEARSLIADGDRLAMGLGLSASEIWAEHLAKIARRRGMIPGPREAGRQSPTQTTRIGSRSTPKLLSSKLSHVAQERPPLPPSVRIDLTTPLALRTLRENAPGGAVMNKSLFRKLMRELAPLPIGQLVLSSLGDSEKCGWLATGIRYVRTHCSQKRLVLHVDLLSASEALIRQCILEGIDHLVIFLNQCSGKWRSRAQAVAELDPGFFRREIAHLVALRNEYQKSSGRICELSVISNNRRSRYALREIFGRLDNLPGLVAYTPVILPAGISKADARARGNCHCLAPFIEAHIRTNGHLVACAQDHSGYSHIADLTQTSFIEAWHSPTFRTARNRVTLGEKPGRLCEVCPHHTAR